MAEGSTLVTRERKIERGEGEVDRACYRVILRGNSSNFPRDRSGAVPRREGEKIMRDPRDRRKVGD